MLNVKQYDKKSKATQMVKGQNPKRREKFRPKMVHILKLNMKWNSKNLQHQ